MLVAFDLGATNLRVAVVDEKRLVKIIKEKTVNDGTNHALINQIVKMIKSLNCPVTKIAGSICGPVDKDGNTPALPQLKLSNILIKKELETTFNCEVKLANDANASCLYEAVNGQGKGCNNVLYVTLSTGIGAGLCINKKIYTGIRGNALEIGKMSFDGRGLEKDCSGKAISEFMDVLDFFKDERKIEHWLDEISDHLANVIFVVDPDILIFGGGIMKSSSLFFSKLCQKINAKINIDYLYDLKMMISEDYETSPLLGAALLVDN